MFRVVWCGFFGGLCPCFMFRFRGILDDYASKVWILVELFLSVYVCMFVHIGGFCCLIFSFGLKKC